MPAPSRANQPAVQRGHQSGSGIADWLQAEVARCRPATLGSMIAAMRLIALVQCFVCALAFGQSNSTGLAAPPGVCSPADAGSNDRFTITCGIGREQGEALLRIMNKILESQLDPSAVMGKLNEISSAIQDIQKQIGDRVFTDSQVSALSRVLRRSPGKHVYLVLLGDREAI